MPGFGDTHEDTYIVNPSLWGQFKDCQECLVMARQEPSFIWCPTSWEMERNHIISSALKTFMEPGFQLDHLPPDVCVKCSNGKVMFHKFILIMYSEFFRVKFKMVNCFNNTLPCPDSVEVVDLTNFSVDFIEILKNWMYTGRMPDLGVFVKKFYGLVYLANYLLIPTVIDICAGLFNDLAVNNYSSPAGVMTVYKLGQRLGEKRLVRTAAKFFHYFLDLPDDFDCVDYEDFYAMIKSFRHSSFFTKPPMLGDLPHHMIRALTSCSGLSAIPRERYILLWIVKFLNYDKPNRLVYATELFKELKLAFIANEIDFVELGLEELNDETVYQELHTLIKMCKGHSNATNLNFLECALNPYYYTPRPNTIRYSLWSQRIGDFHLKVKKTLLSEKRSRDHDLIIDPNNNQKNEEGQIPNVEAAGRRENKRRRSKADFRPSANSFNIKRFRFERGQNERIAQIDVFSKTLTAAFLGTTSLAEAGKVVIAGFRIHWSDGTKDECGHIDDNNVTECRLKPHEAFTIRNAQNGSFLEALHLETAHSIYETHYNQRLPLKLQRQPVTFGPMGGSFNEGNNFVEWTVSRLLGSSLGYSNLNLLLYLDGLKGVELTHSNGKDKIVTGLFFKFTLQANSSLGHLIRTGASRRKRKSSTPENSPNAATTNRFEDENVGGENNRALPEMLQNVGQNLNDAQGRDQSSSNHANRRSRVNDKPRTLTIDLLKAENTYIQVSDLKETYNRQETVPNENNLLPSYRFALG